MHNNGDNNSNQNDDYDDDDYHCDWFCTKSEFNDHADKTAELDPSLSLTTSTTFFSVALVMPVFLIMHRKTDACLKRKEHNAIDMDDDDNLEMTNKQER